MILTVSLIPIKSPIPVKIKRIYSGSPNFLRKKSPVKNAPKGAARRIKGIYEIIPAILILEYSSLLSTSI
jgi:hypothetical protein